MEGVELLVAFFIFYLAPNIVVLLCMQDKFCLAFHLCDGTL